MVYFKTHPLLVDFGCFNKPFLQARKSFACARPPLVQR